MDVLLISVKILRLLDELCVIQMMHSVSPLGFFCRHGCQTIIASRNLQRVAEVSRWESDGAEAGRFKTILAYIQRNQNKIGAVIKDSKMNPH